MGDQKRVHEEINSEKAALTLARQELQAAYHEGRLLYVKSEKQEEQNNKLTTDNKAMKKRVVDLEADIISGSSANLQQNMQQQREQQVVVEDLGKRIEELAEMVQTLSLKSESLTKQNAILS